MTDTERITHRVMDAWQHRNPDVDATDSTNLYPMSLSEQPGMFRTAGAALLWTAKVLGGLAIFAAALYVLIAW